MKTIPVTKPFLPPLVEVQEYLEKIWANEWVTNNGPFHQELEKKLAEYLDVPYVSLFSNGTLALIAAIDVLDLSGEVITTPYSFVATSHSIIWRRCRPVFIDIESDHLNLDPSRIEAAITEKTSAILPVHVYGNPCDVHEIEKIARKHNLKVIYDAAHAFGTKIGEKSILNFGDLSVLSFHATKVFNTIEGGAIVSHSLEMKEKIDQFKNFGFENGLSVTQIGFNAKLNEIQASIGLINLKYIESHINERRRIDAYYRKRLSSVKGIRLIDHRDGVATPCSYFPILINSENFGVTRDEVFDYLNERNVGPRRYFYPLITSYKAYQDSDIVINDDLIESSRASDSVICLPLYVGLELVQVDYICDLIVEVQNKA